MLNNLNSFSSETKQRLRTRVKLKKKNKNHLNWLGTVLEENAMELVFPIDGASGAGRVAGDGVVCHFDATRLIRTAANNARKPWSGWGRWWRRRWRQQRRRRWCREIHIRCYDWIPLPLNLDDVRTSRFSLQTPFHDDVTDWICQMSQCCGSDSDHLVWTHEIWGPTVSPIMLAGRLALLVRGAYNLSDDSSHESSIAAQTNPLSTQAQPKYPYL